MGYVETGALVIVIIASFILLSDSETKRERLAFFLLGLGAVLVGLDDFVQVILDIARTSEWYMMTTWSGLFLIVISLGVLFVWPHFQESEHGKNTETD